MVKPDPRLEEWARKFAVTHAKQTVDLYRSAIPNVSMQQAIQAVLEEACHKAFTTGYQVALLVINKEAPP
jgi:hypothetical protein